MIKTLKQVRRNVLGLYRYSWQKLQLKDIKVGKRFFCQRHLFVNRIARVRMGDDVYLGRYTHIACHLDVGNAVLIASHVAFVGGDHKIDNIGSVPIKFSGREHYRGVTIEDNVWIGHGCILMGGVTVKSGAVVAAGSVVTKDVEANAIVAGSPARLIRHRKV